MFEKIFGGFHVKPAMAELSKSDRGDEVECVKFSDLISGRHSRGRVRDLNFVHIPDARNYILPSDFVYVHFPLAVIFIGSALYALQQLSGINAIFYFSSAVFKSFGVPSNFANICVGVTNLSGMGFKTKYVQFCLAHSLDLLDLLHHLQTYFKSRLYYGNDIDGQTGAEGATCWELRRHG